MSAVTEIPMRGRLRLTLLQEGVLLALARIHDHPGEYVNLNTAAWICRFNEVTRLDLGTDPWGAPAVGSLISALDLFAGPGGWDVAATRLGINVLGIEWDDSACATRKAAGLPTLQGDVAELDPIWSHHDLLIASPPCQAWSMAGKGGGRRDQEHVIRCAYEFAAGNDTRAEHAKQCEDPRSMLVVEPLRWALALQPRWIALEQVPPVLGFWEVLAGIFAEHGWRCWTGVLEAERYGVPQTRERAILMGDRFSQPHPPRATHQRYVFGEPARHEITLEGEVLPWISMAEALGWGMTERPVPTVSAGGTKSGGAEVFAKGGREAIHREQERGAWVVRTENFTGPAGPDGPRKYERPIACPSPTVGSRTDLWCFDRPATTIAGDPRVFQPGGHHQPGQQSANSIRVTVAEAAALQSFPPDHPWQGTKTKQHEQVGNAVPPLLAEAVLTALVDIEEMRDAA